MIGCVIWITGLSGAGKSTIAWALADKLGASAVPHVVIDGDRMRQLIPWPIGHSNEERHLLAEFYSCLAAEMCQQRLVVICATISLFHDIHELNRRITDSYFEVYLRVPYTELARRDVKGIYNKNADVVGIDIIPQFPLQPDIIIDNYGFITPESACDLILHQLIAKGIHI